MAPSDSATFPTHSGFTHILAAYGMRWDAASFRACYEQMLASFRDAGIEPTHLGGKAKGVGKGFRAFNIRHRALVRNYFEDFTHIDIQSKDSYEHSALAGWNVCFEQSMKYDHFWAGLAADYEQQAHECVRETFQNIIVRQNISYGYETCYWMRLCPSFYIFGDGLYGDRSDRDKFADISSQNWHYGGKQNTDYLFRDIYPVNYVSSTLLSMPVGRTGQSVSEWIRKYEQRGRLTQLTKSLWQWDVHGRNIPYIREELFRGGRVYCVWFFIKDSKLSKPPVNPPPGYFQRRDPRRIPDYPKPREYYRENLADPWEAPDEIPAFLTASFYDDKDPSMPY